MRIAILGRTYWLMSVAQKLLTDGHIIALVATAPGQPEYRAQEDDFKKLANQVNAPFHSSPKINSEEFQKSLRDSRAEIGVSINWPTLIRQQTCSIFKYGILNGHAGDLPRYRGNACPNWAIINGESLIGLCVHVMDPDAVDAGDIYVRRQFPIDETVSITEVYNWLDNVFPDIFSQALERVQDPDFEPEDQSLSGITPLRCHPRRPEDSLIDWTIPARDIARLVRASSRPFMGAYSYLEGETKVTIWRCKLVQLDQEIAAVPGQILGRGPSRGILVACGSGIIEIEESELEDGSTLPSANRFRLKMQ